MKRCHKCECVISTGKEVYVAQMPYHTQCAPDHTAAINVRNIKLLNERIEALEARVLELENPL